jgi:hypothetical protein
MCLANFRNQEAIYLLHFVFCDNFFEFESKSGCMAASRSLVMVVSNNVMLLINKRSEAYGMVGVITDE